MADVLDAVPVSRDIDSAAPSRVPLGSELSEGAQPIVVANLGAPRSGKPLFEVRLADAVLVADCEVELEPGVS